MADDHLGEFGIQDLGELADVKLLVARAVRRDGAVVLNGDDALLRERAAAVTAPIVWFSLEPGPEMVSHLAAGGRAALCEDGQLVLAEGKARTPVVPVSEMPAALGGAARHNVANALAALAAAAVLGVAPEAIARTLRRFGRAPDDNAGRANMVELGGVHLVIDYAHNPHGMAALTRMAAALPARRMSKQAGGSP